MRYIARQRQDKNFTVFRRDEFGSHPVEICSIVKRADGLWYFTEAASSDGIASARPEEVARQFFGHHISFLYRLKDGTLVTVPEN